MLRHQLTTIKKQLSQIVDMLILNGTLTECPGLIHGKMGLSIFFFQYAKYTKNMLFADYAFDLIGEIQDQIHINSPADNERGLAGIGTGIGYLIQNNFLSVEDDIFEDLDQRMIRAVLYEPWLNFSMYKGSAGYGRYWISRLHYKSSCIPAQKCLLYIIERTVEKLPKMSIEEQIDAYCLLCDLQRESGFEHCMNVFNKGQAFSFQTTDNHLFPRLENSVVGSVAMTFQRNRYFNDIE